MDSLESKHDFFEKKIERGIRIIRVIFRIGRKSIEDLEESEDSGKS
jgi:hypothetical protein